MHNIAILGSTGSVGTQALAVAAANGDRLRVSVLAAYHNDQCLEEQIHRFQPDLAVLVDENAAARLKQRYLGSTKILSGQEGLLAAATHAPVRTVITSLVGFAGLQPTLAAIQAGKDIALANKETLVAAGALVTAAAASKGVRILPVDSEHSALLQCLQGERLNTVERLILTASGGPFRGMSAVQLQTVTVAQCLKHPNWSMGPKITVDSATLANKGLEVIEAHWLYGVDYDHIDVVVHPQSIVHSMVEFVDRSVMAQLAMPDMKLPIQYALTYPERISADIGRLDFAQLACLTFEKPDLSAFPALDYAFQAGKAGGTMPCVFNAANEAAVSAFLQGVISFTEISQLIAQTLHAHTMVACPALGDLNAADAWARQYANSLLQS